MTVTRATLALAVCAFAFWAAFALGRVVGLDQPGSPPAAPAVVRVPQPALDGIGPTARIPALAAVRPRRGDQ